MEKPISIARGMRDVLPEEQKYWTYLRTVTQKRLQSFGFQPIDTPVVEPKELYLRGAGKDSDIVQKELFAVSRIGNRGEGEQQEETGGSDLVLRPEGTGGFVRAYIEHGMRTWSQPVKLYSFVQNFRYDRPQKGRYRQHTQLNAEVFGDETPLTDAMTLLALWQVIQDLHLDDQLVIELNSIGDKVCRGHIRAALKSYYEPIVSHLCKQCQERFHTNPLRLLDCKEAECQQYREAAPATIDSLCTECRNHFMLVLEYLDEAGVPYDLNHYLVRGLDYYTRTTFEIRHRDDPSRQAVLGGGGRYDDLVEALGGPATPAFGFGLGVERIVEKLIERGIEVQPLLGTEILVIQLGDRAKKKAIPLLVSLSKKGLAASMALGKESLKSQLRSADKMGAKLALIVGEREAIDGTIIVRNMFDGTQDTVAFDDVEQVIERKLAELAQD